MTAARHMFRGQMMTADEIAAMAGVTIHNVYRSIKCGRLDRVGEPDKLGQQCIYDGVKYISVAKAAAHAGVDPKRIHEAAFMLRKSGADASSVTVKGHTFHLLPRRPKR